MTDDRLFWIIMGIIGLAAIVLVINHDSGESFGIGNYEFSRLIWLGAIGVVMGSAVFARGMPVGHSLRQAALWLVIFLAVMVGYQFAERYGLIPGERTPLPKPLPGAETTV